MKRKRRAPARLTNAAGEAWVLQARYRAAHGDIVRIVENFTHVAATYRQEVAVDMWKWLLEQQDKYADGLQYAVTIRQLQRRAPALFGAFPARLQRNARLV